MKRIILVIVGILGVFGVVLLFSKEEKEQVYLTNKEIKESNYMAVMVEQEDGKYQEQDTIPQSGYVLNTEKSKCNNGTILTWESNKLKLSNLTSDNTSCFLYFDKELSTKLVEKLEFTTEKGQDGFTDMDTKEHIDENGKSILYSDEDDLGITYYFRGKVKDNWVKFGKANGQDIWWRIIRINGNGSIRMIYTGTGTNAPTSDGYLNNNDSSSQLQTNAFNEYYNDNKYVGYMYGTERKGSYDNETTPTTSYNEAHANNYDSDIKKVLDNWYSTNLKINYGQYIDPNAGFCNDRKVATMSRSGYGTTGYGKNPTAYAAVDRLLDTSWNANSKHTPTFKCTQKNDTFTLPDAKKPDGSDYGNHKLKATNGTGENSPIGLITIDEAVFAGGYYYRSSNRSDNKQFYLYTCQTYWTMSPYYFDGSNAYVFYVDSNGYLDGDYVDNTYGVRPVINLKADTKLSGDGTYTNPYVVEGAN